MTWISAGQFERELCRAAQLLRRVRPRRHARRPLGRDHRHGSRVHRRHLVDLGEDWQR